MSLKWPLVAIVAHVLYRVYGVVLHYFIVPPRNLVLVECSVTGWDQGDWGGGGVGGKYPEDIV